MEKNENQKNEVSDIAKRELEVLEYWRENKIFEKSLEKDAPEGEFVFYDGPPFATGLPHYGHILAGTIKDVIPRYKTMCGYHVPRRWGWDCHGLPLENQVEKHLGLESKKDIDKYGVEAFNEKAKEFVLRYADDWKKIVPRTGRWVDMEDDYRTMDWYYTESIWWAFKDLHEKDLIYEGFKSMHICPRCETPLSNFEVNQGYKDIKDLSVTVALKLLEESDTYLLVWTTTPWTLPGNMATALNKDITYTKVSHEGKTYIVAKDLVRKIFEGKDYEVVGKISPGDIIGKEYQPPFDYFKDKEFENKENAWKVYEAPYVTTEEGTGIVHLAPAFGAEDLDLAQEENIPIVHHVDEKGKFTLEVTSLSGQLVKPKDEHMTSDIEILKLLDAKGILFGKEKITHSYPHCWRCDTPLLNYATTSWFVKVPELKKKLIEENNNIGWVPEAVGKNRFGDWLEGARDWAISRSRYWGAPMPVWRCEDCEKIHVLGSIEELKKHTKKSGNKYFVMRHGESKANAQGHTVSIDTDSGDVLTDKGESEVQVVAKELKDSSIDLIVTSPLERTKQTAKMVAEHLGIELDKVIVEQKIGEWLVGKSWQGKSWSDVHKAMDDFEDRFHSSFDDGESLLDLRRRALKFMYELEDKFNDKTILVVTHSAVGKTLIHGISNEDDKNITKALSNAEVREFEFISLPHNKNFELDLHLPYIDEVPLKCECGGLMRRIPEVFDCWFESGSMPFAQKHYPFENLEDFDPKESSGYPANFIAEGLDQTRGWFYSLLVLGTALFGKSPYQNVIVNGLILAEDGQKMSKRLKNYPDPLYVMDKYGADAMRYYMISSPVVRAEDLAFSEDEVDEVVKKLILRITNSFNFLEMYAQDSLGSEVSNPDSKNVLDRWIISRINQTSGKVTNELEKYSLDRASRPILDFVDDFSTWYIRRSRDRFRGGDNKDRKNALETTKYVLLKLSKVMAPFTPFVSEWMYGKLSTPKKSVHLEDWPKAGGVEKDVLEDMGEVRRIVSNALEIRAREGIKVRQPLRTLRVQNQESRIKNQENLLELIRDEVNVKEVVFDAKIKEGVELDTKITPELKKEGLARDLIRSLQKIRKKEGLSPEDLIVLEIEADKASKDLIEEFQSDIKSTAGIKKLEFGNVARGEELKLGELEIKIKVIEG